jgi:chromosome partitioning protein
MFKLTEKYTSNLNKRYDMEPKMLLADAAVTFNLTPQAIHNQLKRKQLEHKKSKNRIYFTHETAKSLFEIKFISQIISFQIVKGGTGKTSICLSIGVRSCLYGARTLLIDLDQQGNLTKACGVTTQNNPVMIEIINQNLKIEEGIINVLPGLDILPSRIENALLDPSIMLKRFPLEHLYKDMLNPLKEKYDVILIDCPPALGSSVTAATLASDRVISPVTPSEFSLTGLEITSKEIENIEKQFKVSITLCPLLNEYDARTTLSPDTMRMLVSHPKFEHTLLRSVVRKSQEFENTLVKGISIYDSLNANPAKEDVDLLTRELLNINQEKKGTVNFSVNRLGAIQQP